MRRTAIVVVTAALLGTAGGPASAREGSELRRGAIGAQGVVATESPAAARVGRGVLETGGNAMDAAAATVFAIGVARPQSCGVGGGGFLVHRSGRGAVSTLDFRETAPAAITPGQFTGPGPHREFTGHTTVGVPGVVAGLDAALRRYGTMGLRQVIAPAERLARAGVRVPRTLATGAADNAARLGNYGPSAAIFAPGGRPLQWRARFRQPELAATYRRLMRGGARAFYRGTIARRIAAEMAGRGLLTADDLAGYRPVWRAPVSTTYRGHQVFSMGPPTSGGVALVEMLNLLEPLDLRAHGLGSAAALHLMAEAQRIAWADRNQYLADPGFVRQPARQLTSKAYADGRRGEIALDRTAAHGPGDVAQPGSTTHVSVLDRRGNAVALTCTIEQEFGSAVTAPGTGFLLNNELTDFGPPGTANEPAPGKRPRSSMTPVIVTRAGRPVLVTGAAGGSLIIMGVTQTVLNVIEFGLDVPHAVDAERIDNQGGTALRVEDARLDPAVLADLEQRGWTLTRQGMYGPRPRVQAAGLLADGRMVAVSDPRADDGSLAVRPRRPVACVPVANEALSCPAPPAAEP